MIYTENQPLGFCVGQHNEPQNYNYARDKCRKAGGDLLSVTSSSQLSYIRGKTCPLLTQSFFLTFTPGLMSTSVYIGLNDIATEGNFQWSDGTPRSWLPSWASPNPDNAGANSNEDCVELKTDGTMADIDCASIRPYICDLRRVFSFQTRAGRYKVLS